MFVSLSPPPSSRAPFVNEHFSDAESNSKIAIRPEEIAKTDCGGGGRDSFNNQPVCRDRERRRERREREREREREVSCAAATAVTLSRRDLLLRVAVSLLTDSITHTHSPSLCNGSSLASYDVLHTQHYTMLEGSERERRD